MNTLHSDPRVLYAFSVLLNQDSDAFALPSWLSYGTASEAPAGSRLHITTSGFFGETYGTPASLPAFRPAMIEGVPVLFGEPRTERRGDVLLIHADIAASAYFLTTRYEEWMRPDVRDEHGRFPGRESFAARAQFIDRPVVDEYSRLLRDWAGQAGITVLPPARRFSVLLTHDVDSLGPKRGVMPTLKAIARGVTGQTRVPDIVRETLWAGGLRQHPRDNLASVIALDAQLIDAVGPERCRAMYFFMAGGRTEHDAKYRIYSGRMRRRLAAVLASGAAVGLHASYAAGDDQAQIGVERRTLADVTGRAVEANRHHFLRWREPEHGVAIRAAGIQWDSTLGYADVAGFRLGVCRPIALFDPVARRLMGIEEHPLVAMDCTLDRPEYMNLDEASAFDYMCRLAATVRDHQGEFVILWHNTELVPSALNYHGRLYGRVLAHLAELMRCE